MAEFSGGKRIEGDHTEIDPATGMQRGYVILSEEERAKGFVRPVRRTYIHVGKRPKYPTRPLTPDEEAKYKYAGYAVYEPYPESESPVVGRFWTQAELDSGCGAETRMAQDIAETYARKPDFYGGTYCVGCRKHLPVDEFVWKDNPDQRVGS